MTMDERDQRARDASRIIWGLFVIIVGLVLLADRTDLIPFHFSGNFWPLVLIMLGVLKLAQPLDARRGRTRRSGGFLIFVGGWGLINELHIGGLDYRTSWPILVIGVGVAMVWRAWQGNPTCDNRIASGGNHAA